MSEATESASETKACKERKSRRMPHGHRLIQRALKDKVKKTIMRQIKKLKEKRARLALSEEKRSAMLESNEDISKAVEKGYRRAQRQFAKAERELAQLKALEVDKIACSIWNDVNSSHSSDSSLRRTNGLDEGISSEVEALVVSLTESKEVAETIERVVDDIRAAKKRKKRKFRTTNNVFREKGAKLRHTDPEATTQKLGKRDAKRASRAEQWRAKQAEKLKSESKSYRIARARVAESVFLDNLSMRPSIPTAARSFRSEKTRIRRAPPRDAPNKRERQLPKKDRRDKEVRRPPQVKKKKTAVEDKTPLHPSWAAKKLQKASIVSFKGARITFDD